MTNYDSLTITTASSTIYMFSTLNQRVINSVTKIFETKECNLRVLFNNLKYMEQFLCKQVSVASHIIFHSSRVRFNFANHSFIDSNDLSLCHLGIWFLCRQVSAASLRFFAFHFLDHILFFICLQIPTTLHWVIWIKYN